MLQKLSISATVLKLFRYGRRLWVRVSLMALLGVIAPGAAALLAPFIPKNISESFTPEAVMPILTILASGMLAVSTFSLNVMVTAHRAASAQATPRAHRILLSDTTTQSVLATFIGSFVYALTAIIMFQSHLVWPGTSVVMLGITVLIVVLVILAMLRWIDHLSNLGSMDATLQATEDEARPSLMQSRSALALGASPLTSETVLPAEAKPVYAPTSGYVQFIDLPSLDEALGDGPAVLYLDIVPGSHVLKGQKIGHAAGLVTDGEALLHDNLIIGKTRTFEQDAAYGLLVLSEIASRALSPGINDPGTAIDVIMRQVRLLWKWAKTPQDEKAPAHPRIFLHPLSAQSLVESAFSSIARDGAGTTEVAICLQKGLRELAGSGDEALSAAAGEMSRHARTYANDVLLLDTEKDRINKIADTLGSEGLSTEPEQPGAGA